MGNSFGGKKKSVKIMKVDGATFEVKAPAQAVHVLRDHPGYTLLDSSQVKHLGVRAKPLDLAAPLKPGKLYFLVETPRLPDPSRLRDAPRRAWSGTLQLGARERLESLKLTRRAMSDLTIVSNSAVVAAEAEAGGGVVRVRMRLPKAQVEKLMQESRDSAEAMAKIMDLCVWKDDSSPRKSPEITIPAIKNRRVEIKAARFVALPDEIIA